MRIAICDDNSMDLKAMREVFRRVAPAYTLDSFSDSRKLLDTIAGGTSYDLLFLDILMPGITGMELAREVGRIAPDMPVVFLTDSDAYAVEAFSVKALRSGRWRTPSTRRTHTRGAIPPASVSTR